MRVWRALVVAIAVGACTAPPAPQRLVMKCPTIPKLRHDEAAAPARPAAAQALTLTPGHWDWTGMDYTWVRPAWVPRTGGHIWQDGFWTASGIACFWTPGRLAS